MKIIKKKFSKKIKVHFLRKFCRWCCSQSCSGLFFLLPVLCSSAKKFSEDRNFHFSRKLGLKRSRVLIKKLSLPWLALFASRSLKKFGFVFPRQLFHHKYLLHLDPDFSPHKQKEKNYLLFFQKSNPYFLKNRTKGQKIPHWPGQSIKFFFLSFRKGMKLMPCGELYE